MNRQQRRAGLRPDKGKSGPTRSVAGLFEQALRHHQAGSWAEAEQLYQEILAHDPRHDGALHYLGVLAYQLGRCDIAEVLIGQAVALRPDHAEAHNNLGTALWRQGKLDEAESRFQQALALKPAYPEAHNNLANVFKDQGRLNEAVNHYGRALALRPGYPEAHNNLGAALQTLGRLSEAVEHYGQALALKPAYPEAHNNLGNALLRLGRLPDALPHYQEALRLNPGYAEAHNNLGGALLHQGRLSEAAACFERAVTLKPDFAGALNNLGSALQSQGLIPEAIARFEQALAIAPDYEEAHRNLIYSLLYQPGTTLAELRAAALRWGSRHADPLTPAEPRRRPDPAAAGRRPKLGFVSGDFREHVVGRLTIPVLEALSRAGHAFVCYSNHPIEDGLSARFKAAAAAWRPIHGLDDDAAVERIRADGIDILFDLSGYTADNRLLLFARKPAPLQITWLGYPATTGMAAMDYLLADPALVPAEADHHYREKIIRLPAGYHLYRPLPDAPEVVPPPLEREDAVTFGSFNGVQKLARPAIECWSRILRSVPGSRLVLKAPGFNDPVTCRRYREMLREHGIDDRRLSFIGRTPPAEHLAAMSAVDVALDSFPYTGGATTVDALWMGAPVVALAGETMGSRLSAGYLSAIGLSELIARNMDHYVELAVGLAREPARLVALRHDLRQRMVASPLCDEAFFTRHLEQACQTIWTRHCLSAPPVSIEAALPLDA